MRKYGVFLYVSDVFSQYIILDLIDRHIDFDQWEFCLVWATRISSFLGVLSAVS
jgi:hypothetical protein